MHIEKLTFNNMFSYGEGNEISFIDNKVTLIEGKLGQVNPQFQQF